MSGSGSGGAASSSATGAGTRSDVTLKLPQLQNLCKRDPVAYRDDYEAQVRRLESELNVLKHQPNGAAGAMTTAPPMGSSLSSDRVVELIQFTAAVSSSSYKGEEADRISSLLMSLLGATKKETDGNKANNNMNIISTLPTAAVTLHRDVRKATVSALILMRNKGTVAPLLLLPLFFSVMSTVPDKALRDLLYRHIVNDIRNINKKGKRDEKVNRSIQSFLHRILQQNSAEQQPQSNLQQPQQTMDEASVSIAETACKRAVDMVCELYRSLVWTDDRTVAILASAVSHANVTVCARAMRFFLGIEEKIALDERTRKEQEYVEKSGHVDLHLHSRKTCRRARQTERALKNKKKALHKKETLADWMDETPEHDKGVEASKKLYPALELLRDPQGLAEAVFRRLQRGGGGLKYETKLLMINFVTRLTGNHELLLLPLYTFLQKYMGACQRDVTAILAYTVQACHSLVPPDEVYGILKTISHNFITERCSEEQMAVGINAVRAICARVPSCLSSDGTSEQTTVVSKKNARRKAKANETMLENNTTTAVSEPTETKAEEALTTSGIAMDMEAFARDLAAYASHRDRSVAIAGKAWLNFVREVHPALLAGKDRGLKGSALLKYYDGQQQRPNRYGEHVAPVGVEGADLLVEYEAQKKAAVLKRRMNADSVDDEANDEWEEVEDSDDEKEQEEDEDESEEVENGKDDENDSEDWEDMDEENASEDEDAPTLVPLDDGGKPSDDPKMDIPNVAKMTRDEREKLKQQVSSTRIFSAADFSKMRKLVERENRAKYDPREAARRKRAIARGQEFEALSDTESETESMQGDNVNIKGTVNPEDIMATATRKRQSKAERIEKILSGRTQFEATRREGGSTNIEKKRKKNFVMSKFSREARSKGRGKSHSQMKRTGLDLKGTHDSRKRRRKV